VVLGIFRVGAGKVVCPFYWVGTAVVAGFSYSVVVFVECGVEEWSLWSWCFVAGFCTSFVFPSPVFDFALRTRIPVVFGV
jgi:hypothetical protein